MSHSLWLHGLQHARPPCPTPTPRAYWNSCPSSWWCHPTISFSVVPSPTTLNLSQHQDFLQWFSFCISWPKYWSFSFSISPSNEYSGLTSFRMDWLDPLAIQGTLKSLLQHHSSKASVLRHSVLYSPTVTFIHDYWKNHGLDRQTFVGKVLSLLFLICCLGWS